ncbi:hypothetical protein M9H77_02956 [Catharanthus roseus]|uniref:Uncharacterized protein n=1 Tax=Catharanthus roseus TaxID=4058 RepID=A0ACC0C9S7_CATRO|nr:hypothetical protein M9H77_02956 [Catharanthus roseus]
MKFHSSHVLVFILFLSVNILSFNTKIVSAQCQGDFQGLIQQCSQYVQKSGPKVIPSQLCCKVLKNVDLPCICHYINQDVEKIISIEKAVYVASFCGKPIPHRTKCGSYIVP